MKRYPLSSLILAAVATLLPLLAESCINDPDNGTSVVEYTVTPQSSNGTSSLPSAVKSSMKAYLFIGGRYSGIVTADSAGRYNISYDESQGSATLVTIGASSTDSLSVTVPSTGDAISSAGLGVNVIPDATCGYTLPAMLYYGSTTYTAGSGVTATTVALSNQPATLRVVVRNLEDVFGAGSYSVVLSGFRSRMLFDGTVTGDAVSYTPPSTFDGEGSLHSSAVRTFPTMSGEHVKISVYKASSSAKATRTGGTLIWSSDKDSDGNYVTLSSGDNKVLEVTCNGKGEVTLKVIDWSVYSQQVITP